MFKDKFGQETMTVSELISALQDCDPSLPVYTEGCDCTGNALKITVNKADVLINRSH